MPISTIVQQKCTNGICCETPPPPTSWGRISRFLVTASPTKILDLRLSTAKKSICGHQVWSQHTLRQTALRVSVVLYVQQPYMNLWRRLIDQSYKQDTAVQSSQLCQDWEAIRKHWKKNVHAHFATILWENKRPDLGILRVGFCRKKKSKKKPKLFWHFLSLCVVIVTHFPDKNSQQFLFERDECIYCLIFTFPCLTWNHGYLALVQCVYIFSGPINSEQQYQNIRALRPVLLQWISVFSFFHVVLAKTKTYSELETNMNNQQTLRRWEQPRDNFRKEKIFLAFWEMIWK